MNEGASACAGGVAGACDALNFPGFLWPGVVVLALTLLVLVFLSRKKVIKIQLKMLFLSWLVLVLVFAGIVYLKIESAGDRTQQEAERCYTSGNPACEY